MPDNAIDGQPRAPVKSRIAVGLVILSGLIVLAIAVNAPRVWQAYSSSRLKELPLPKLESLAKGHPDNLEARYNLGLAYARADRYRDAIQEFLAVLDKDPTRADVLNDLGVAYLVQERFYEALTAFQGALTANPDFAPAQANMGRLHLATKMPYTAARDLERAVKLNPRNVPTLCDLGSAYIHTLNFKLAEDTYQRAIRLDPKAAAGYVGLGEAYLNMGRYRDAETILKKVQEIAPEDPSALLTLARAKFNLATSQTDLDSIRQMLQSAAKSDPGDPEIWYELGRVALRLGKTEEALEMQLRALRLSPNHAGALHQLERALRAAGRVAEADRAAKIFQNRALMEREQARLEEKTTRSPDDWDAKARLAEVYLLSGRRGLGTLIVRQLKENKPDHPLLPRLLERLKPPTQIQVPAALLQGGR